ncbi:MAG: hypothetical protein QM811_24205 [Pirellulales bacterium]
MVPLIEAGGVAHGPYDARNAAATHLRPLVELDGASGTVRMTSLPR